MSELCLTLLCPHSAAESLLDLLLMSSGVSVFTSAPAAAHGTGHTNLSQMEQVLGMPRMTQIQAIIDATDKETLLAAVGKQFSGIGVRYWLMPVIDAGEFA